MNKKKKVLVIGHDASLSGAPVLLLNLFKLLIENGEADVLFVIRRDGPLVEEYARLGRVIVLKPVGYSTEKNIFRRLKNFIQNKIKLIDVILGSLSCAYVFSNTVENGKLLRWLFWHRRLIVTYVNELENVIDLLLRQRDANFSLKHSRVMVCPAKRTEEMLVAKYGVQLMKIKRLNYFFSFFPRQFDPGLVAAKRTGFRNKIGIAATDFVVCGMGSVNQRKGFDFFIEVCRILVKENAGIKFCWVGAFENPEQEEALRNTIKTERLEKSLFFTGPVDRDIFNTAAFDIFFLSSREDPYPLVVLEAAMMKVPTVCFADSGGITEFIENDAGWMIEGFSTIAAAEKLIELKDKKDIVRKYGETAFKKVIDRHCNADRVLAQYRSIEEALNR
jgi:glycosyltransferase involved in cell wall biosynthesis